MCSSTAIRDVGAFEPKAKEPDVRLLWIVICVMCLVLAGCGDGGNTDSPAENGNSESGPAGHESPEGGSSDDGTDDGSAEGPHRSCQEVPESGDPGDGGAGLKVAILLTVPDDTDMTLEFPVGDPCHTWSRTADPDQHDSESHLHYNAADRTAFVGGTFRWTEYGPEHSQEAIDSRCANDEQGTTKYATLSDSCEDHNGILIRVSDVSNP